MATGRVGTNADGSQWKWNDYHRRLDRYLTTTGDGLGVYDAVGDYSGAAEEFYIEPQGNDVLVLYRVFISLRDAGTFAAEKYGYNLVLTNGISVFHEREGVQWSDMTAGVPIKTNADWKTKMFDFDPFDIGIGDNYAVGRWTFAKAGTPLRLIGRADGVSDRLVFRLNDDFTGLVQHRFLVQGFYENYDI